MLKIKTLEIMTAAFMASAMVSCFGSDNNVPQDHINFNEQNTTVLPHDVINDNPFIDVQHDISIDVNTKFTKSY